MNTSRSFAALMLSLTLLGAGCTIGQQKAANPTGGMWYSPDRGTSWKQIPVLYTSNGVGSWSETDIVASIIDPNDPNALYAGTRANGLFYSYDSGKTWMQPKDIATGPVQAIAVDPKSKCSIYVARLTQIWKSDDCNRNYRRLFMPELGQDFFRDIVVDWYNPTIVYAISRNGAFFKSTTSGASWATPFKFDNRINTLVMDPANSRVLFVGTEGNGVMRSTDGGTTWVSLKEAAKEIQGSDTAKAIAPAKSDEGTWIVAIANGLMRTKDSGDTWEVVKTLTNPPLMNIISLVVDPTNSSVIYYGTEAVFYRTANGGENWETVKLPTARPAGTLLVHPETTNALYMGARNPAK